MIDYISNIYEIVNAATIYSNINDNQISSFHEDERDIGEGCQHLFPKLFMDSRIDIVGCSSKVIQFVTVISYKLYEDSQFGIIELVGNPIFTLKTPLFDNVKETDESLRCVTYGMDYSNTFHGNVVTSHLFPRNTWALRITTYGTVHTACWNNV